jgi:hypothetical protein
MKIDRTVLAMIFLSILGVLAVGGLITVLFVPIQNDDARQVLSALTAIASAVVGGLIFWVKRESPHDPPPDPPEETKP